ncbi:GTPase HflX [Desulfosarcina sp.]|uniref:GTPase HflX n=1 Tax=Desulfosarcina sp. TaxID=2027861 RepID=UPI0029A44B45|nr:GTPase HflX [Desulfosarcina sp.]MDX2451252.1 GTPase HflX [Desulfosarcina sp.]MDX2489082.1 GTPase HflX [Desulfosarcina sp.]
MKEIFGNLLGLKASQIRRLENLSRRRVPPQDIISHELCRDLCALSAETSRQIGLLIDRSGRIVQILMGEVDRIVIPDLKDYRLAPDRLRGLRCIHTHLNETPLTQDDLTDLALLRLDLMAVVTMTGSGEPALIHWAHILPGANESSPYQIMDPIPPFRPEIDCLSLIQALEAELARKKTDTGGQAGAERALLVSVFTGPRKDAVDSLDELEELTRTANISIIDTVLQQRKKANPRFLMGSGKLDELSIMALHRGATLIIFDQELNPSQIRSIADRTEIKVIDRTQLILDIFAQRAQTREGKLQVELAQLKYILPRLVTKDTAMSRLTGGIGGRGPGETRLEISRRRARDRIRRLEQAVATVQKNRSQQRSRRSKKGLPIISIIGYTNAGKSTLLNQLTHSRVLAENKLFATLDPSSRRLRFPRDIEVIITDTVGFIRDLPKELMAAFRATLEELENADLLLHIIDISNPRHPDQIRSVETILDELNLCSIPMIRVLNKMDRVNPEIRKGLIRRLDGIAVSALNRSTLKPLSEKMEAAVEHLYGNTA